MSIKADKQYNTTICSLFDAPKFGSRATASTPDNMVVEVQFNNGKVEKKEFGTGFRSMPFDDANLAALKQIQAGDRLLIRLGPNLSSRGSRIFFAEIQKPQAVQTFQNSKSKTETNARQEDDI